MGLESIIGSWVEINLKFFDEVNSVATSLRINYIDDLTEPIDHCEAAMLDFVVQEETVEEEKTEEVFDLDGFLDEFAWIFQSGFVFDPASPSFKKILAILDQVPFPIPMVVRFSRQGVVEIRTTKPLLLPTESEMVEFVRVFMEEEFLVLSLKPTDERSEISGKPLFMPELFAVTNGTETESESDTRYLQSEEAPAEPTAEPLSFNWTVTNYTNTKIELKLFFS